MVNKKGSTFGVLILIILIGILIALLYMLYLNWPREPVDLKTIIPNNAVNENIEYSSSEQFYESMRYQEKVISYFIADSCDENKRQNMLSAFSLLEEKTILNFVSEDNDANIKILCSNIAPDVGQENYFVAGEGGPSKVINSSLYSIIFEGKIALYREEKCNEPKIAVHELLHSLGFDHNNNPNSILYPTLDCNQKIDEQIIKDINRLYSVNSFPDLKFFRVDASKGGRYLNFEIEVINQGIIDAKDVKMTLYSDEEKIQDFDLDIIEVGSRKILTVGNLKLPSLNSERIVFVIDEDNDIPELFENNNEVELVLE